MARRISFAITIVGAALMLGVSTGPIQEQSPSTAVRSAPSATTRGRSW